MTTDRELLQQALDALEYAANEIGCPSDDDSIGISRKALRARLAQPEQEPIKHWSDCAVHNAPAYPSGKCDCGGFPVAWFDPKGVHLEFDIEDCFSFQEKEGYKPLYTAPPQREFMGLTDEEIRGFEIWLDEEEEKHGWNPPADIVKYMETKLKEKNHG